MSEKRDYLATSALAEARGDRTDAERVLLEVWEGCRGCKKEERKVRNGASAAASIDGVFCAEKEGASRDGRGLDQRKRRYRIVR